MLAHREFQAFSGPNAIRRNYRLRDRPHSQGALVQFTHLPFISRGFQDEEKRTIVFAPLPSCASPIPGSRPPRASIETMREKRKKVRKAVLPVAGLGTRFLPAKIGR